jgi:Asp-tRNA(Asn)/Glu-tRNA(Gln) amidotransferase A subunit family amidase
VTLIGPRGSDAALMAFAEAFTRRMAAAGKAAA